MSSLQYGVPEPNTEGSTTGHLAQVVTACVVADAGAGRGGRFGRCLLLVLAWFANDCGVLMSKL